MAKPATDLTHRLPTSDEVRSANEAAIALARAKSRDGALIVGEGSSEQLRLAPAISELLVDILGHIARGEMVTFVPVGSMLTTQQAADLLNVSRPYLSGLLKNGEIPFVPIGSHRRVKFEDLIAYKNRRDSSREAALNELARLGQEFDAS